MFFSILLSSKNVWHSNCLKNLVQYRIKTSFVIVTLFQQWQWMPLTLSLPSSDYYTPPPELESRNFPPPSPAITCIIYIILPRERNIYPQVVSHQNRFCRQPARVLYRIPLWGKCVWIILFQTRLFMYWYILLQSINAERHFFSGSRRILQGMCEMVKI